MSGALLEDDHSHATRPDSQSRHEQVRYVRKQMLTASSHDEVDAHMTRVRQRASDQVFQLDEPLRGTSNKWESLAKLSAGRVAHQNGFRSQLTSTVEVVAQMARLTSSIAFAQPLLCCCPFTSAEWSE